jgi:dihydrofolate synthase/folylpolyglutamate synthase
MNYQETLDFLFSIEKFGIKLGLERIREYLDKLGNPHHQYPSIHIAGTNGKGSTAAMIQSILTSAGYKVGLLTSPHLVDFAERMRIGYRNCESNYIVNFVKKNRELMNEIPVSFFEITTAMAFQYFADKEVDAAVVEVGMGGRLDATNVLNPLISIITNIDYEHTKSLGNTLEAIATEKGGIIKPGVPCITASKDYVVKKTLRKICNDRKSNLISIYDENQWLEKRLSLKGTSIEVFTRSRKYNNLFINLSGRHQLENAITALTAIEIMHENGFKINQRAVLAGFRDIYWKGRQQILSEKPLVITDVAHNSAGIKTLKETLTELAPGRRIIVVFGILSDKDHTQMLNDISKFAETIILTKPVTERAADPEVLAQTAKKFNQNCQVIPLVREAYNHAVNIARENDIVVVTGSHYTVGEILAALGKYQRYK